MAEFLVKVPLVIAKRSDGSDAYLYEGVPVPDGLRDGELERLKEGEFVGPVGGDEDDDKKPARKSAASK